jgi:hypothetical protein
MSLGHPTSPSRKGPGQHSLLGKRMSRRAVHNDVPQDPRDMAKARLPEIQSQEVLRRPTATAAKSGVSLCKGQSFGPLQLRRLSQRAMRSTTG